MDQMRTQRPYSTTRDGLDLSSVFFSVIFFTLLAKGKRKKEENSFVYCRDGIAVASNALNVLLQEGNRERV